jgi:AHBA synthesis associated protein
LPSSKLERVAIFDFNGVIIDSIDVQRLAFLESYKHVGGKGSPSFATFLSHSGESVESIFLKMGLPSEMADTYREISRRHVSEICLYPEIEEVLRHLRNLEVRLVLLTGKDRDRVNEILIRLGISDCFDLVLSSTEIKNGKTDRTAFDEIERIFGKSLRCVMVGDGPNDIRFAKICGIGSVAASWGEVAPSRLESESPDFIAETPKEILKYLETSGWF